MASLGSKAAGKGFGVAAEEGNFSFLLYFLKPVSFSDLLAQLHVLTSSPNNMHGKSSSATSHLPRPLCWEWMDVQGEERRSSLLIASLSRGLASVMPPLLLCRAWGWAHWGRPVPPWQWMGLMRHLGGVKWGRDPQVVVLGWKCSTAGARQGLLVQKAEADMLGFLQDATVPWGCGDVAQPATADRRELDFPHAGVFLRWRSQFSFITRQISITYISLQKGFFLLFRRLSIFLSKG